jgi:diadenosine tetraphosphatase ApaH/serine/threonine PP2A family protein phosphatase
LFGFRLECLERLGDEAGVFVWRRINELFNYLPLAASIEGKILCMHGGIGRSINKVCAACVCACVCVCACMDCTTGVA